MVNIWKVGSWPGLWGENTFDNKEKFALKYAIPFDFIAIGSGYLPDLKGWTKKEIKKEIKNKTDKSKEDVDFRTETVNDFVNKMKIGDVVFLDLDGNEGYIGEISSEYYYVGKNSKLNFIKETKEHNYAPHRRDVCWKHKNRYFEALRFSNVNLDIKELKGSVLEIRSDHIERIENTKLKKYLKVMLSVPYLID